MRVAFANCTEFPSLTVGEEGTIDVMGVTIKGTITKCERDDDGAWAGEIETADEDWPRLAAVNKLRALIDALSVNVPLCRLGP